MELLKKVDIEKIIASIEKPGPRSRRLTTRQAAEMLGILPQTLRKWRMEGKGPAFNKSARRSARVSYSKLEVQRYIDVNVFDVKCKSVDEGGNDE